MDNNKINEGTRPKSYVSTAALTLCVSTKTVEKFVEVMQAYERHSKNPTPEMATYLALNLDAIALEVRITQAERDLMNSARRQNGTVSPNP
jgi:hypothetical protein